MIKYLFNLDFDNYSVKFYINGKINGGLAPMIDRVDNKFIRLKTMAGYILETASIHLRYQIDSINTAQDMSELIKSVEDSLEIINVECCLNCISK
jgi:hypothetical protein